LYLTRTIDLTFADLTPKGKCLSSWRGASWVSSDVTITTEGLTSWDRGWMPTTILSGVLKKVVTDLKKSYNTKTFLQTLHPAAGFN
jgi:hypothetical protein